MSEFQSSQNERNEMCSMNFSDPNHGNVILESLQALRESKEFCDVVIHVENRKFHLHRNVLCTFSTYFESIFQRKLAARETFNVTSQSAEIFEAFVHYMYTGTIVIDKENVAEMLRLANRLEVDTIKSFCTDYLEKSINLSNCLAVKDLADKYKIPLISSLALDFIRLHLNEVLAGPEVLGLDVFKLEKFLSNKAFGLTQLQVMQVIINWTKKDVSKREKQLKPILKLIKWMAIDIQHINDIIENDSLFTTSQMSLYLMLTHLRENGLTFAQFHSVLDELSEKYSHMYSEKETEDSGTVTKLKMNPKKLDKKKRLLRANPIARLAALKSALLIKTRRNNWLSGIKSGRLSRLKKSESSLKCHLCDHHAKDTTALEQHLSSVHSRDVTYKCGVCGFVCQWNNLYIEHIRGHFPGPPYKCDSCDFTNDKLTSVLTHRSKHVQEKIYRCQQCSFNSKSQTTVLVHSKIHLPPPPKAGKKSGKATYEKAYACDLCGFTTKFLSHLAAHKRIHSTGVYRCSHLNCKFTTGKKAQLMSHVKTHKEGVRPHCCNICGRGFAEKSHLVRHERIHLKDKPFKCDECDYGSSRRDKLKEHLARHHEDNPLGRIKKKPTKKPIQEKAKDSTDMNTEPTTIANEVQIPPPEKANDAANVPTADLKTHVEFTTNETQVHHSTSSSTAATTELDFHEPNPTKGRVKEPTSETSSLSSHQSSTPTAIEAAVIIDPRVHPINTSGEPYTVTAIPVATIVSPKAAQSVQAGHQVAEYSTAIMSLL